MVSLIFFDFCEVIKYRLQITLLFLILLPSLLFAQKQSRFWYFGNHAGLDFSTSPPTALTNGAMSAFEGCATISDTAGNLQFYTDGSFVWNRNNIPMPSGNGLYGNGAATQTAIIVPAPGNPNLYYIFTVDTNGGPRGLCYTEVDMTLNGGLGDVTSKNVLLQTPVTEKLTAVRHANGIDAWVLVHDWGTSNFYAFDITSTGINTTPVVSNSGIVQSGNFTNSHGYLKSSANAKKLACAIRGQNSAQVFDFDNSTGTVSNPITLSFTNQTYGVEFSPNSNLVYIATSSNPATITQFDLTAGNAAAVSASGIVLVTYSGFIGALQLGMDKKIYACQFQSANLATIDFPDVRGLGATFTPNSLFLGGKTSEYGLPNFLQSFFITADFTYADTCSKAPTNFTLVFNNPDSVKWDFGDITSGSSDSSSALNPSHTYLNGGNYTVTLIVYQSLLTDTVRKTIQIISTPQPDLGSDINSCIGSNNVLSPGIMPPTSTYLWSDNSTGNTYLASVTDTVSIAVTYLNCVGRDTVIVNYNPPPAVAIGPDKNVCEGTPVVLSATTPNATYLWQDGSTDSIYNVIATGQYTVKVTVNSCSSSSTALITVDPKPSVFLGNDTTICKGFQLFLDVTNANSTYVWQDGTTNSIYFVSDPGLYSVTVTSGTCVVSDSIFVDQQDKPIVFLGEDTMLCAGQPLILNAYNYGAYYEWQDGSSDSIYKPGMSGKYYVTATNQCGIAADTIEVTLLICDCKVFVPNAFTPNADTKNDVFKIKYNCTEFSMELRIWNRIGQLLFDTTDPDNGWDGTYKGVKAEEGVYLYELKYLGYDNGRYINETVRKTFLLLR